MVRAMDWKKLGEWSGRLRHIKLFNINRCLLGLKYK